MCRICSWPSLVLGLPRAPCLYTPTISLRALPPPGQRHIRVGKQIVNIPSFMVRTDSQKHIDFAVTSPYGGGRPGRNKRKSIASKGGGGGGGDDEEME